jgi:FkbH-like protein
MRLVWGYFDEIGLPRIVQLINKSNQFNLTTRRYSEGDIRAMMRDPTTIGLQLRLIDRFGDNGMIAVLILRLEEQDALIDTWLMSCRVLGRKVEEASLQLLVQAAKTLNATRLVGEYRASEKNSMVATHYQKLCFTAIERAENESRSAWFAMTLSAYQPTRLPMVIEPAIGSRTTEIMER